jgi:hypothetical protein
VVILLATSKHFTDAGLLLWRPGVGGSIGLSGMLLAIPNRVAVAIILIISSILALHALVNFSSSVRTKFASLALQQTLLLIMAGGAIAAIIAGQYADEYIPDGGSAFIIADQMPRIFFATAHIFAVYRYAIT